MLNFDEFRAVSNREKSKTNVIKNASASKAKIDQVNLSEEQINLEPRITESSLLMRASSAVGEFLEIHQMQSVYILLILLDTFAALASAHIQQRSSNIASFISNAALVRTLQSFLAFTLMFFACEIVAVILVFGTKVLGHFGYLLDFTVVIYQINCSSSGDGGSSRLLNVFRFWRLFRLFSSMVQVEHDLHAATLVRLEESAEQLRAQVADSAGLRSDLSKEREARAAIESMLGSYKEEVDTLNEALRIAAMDIAEVAQDDEGDDEGDHRGDDSSLDSVEENSTVNGEDADSAAGDSSKASSGSARRFSHKSAVMRAVMSDSASQSRRAPTQTHGEPRGMTGAFLVHEDGTFEQK